MKDSDKNKVVVFFGGKSVEREVSIITGIQVINNLNPFKNDIFPVYIDEQGNWFSGDILKEITFFKSVDKSKLKSVCLLPNSDKLWHIKGKKIKAITKVDAIINCCHGTSGEDGALAGVIKSSGITHCSPDVLSSAVSMDKNISKVVFKGLGFDVLPFVQISKNEFLNNSHTASIEAQKIGYPVIVKPCNLGSSIGVSICHDEIELYNSLQVAFAFDHFVLIEKALVDFCEFNCSCMGNIKECKVSEVEKITNKSNMLNFTDKYIKSKGRQFPAKIAKNLKNQIQMMTQQIYKVLKCRGIIRIDFLFDNTTKQLFVNEVNVIPGSLAFMFYKKDYDFSDLLEKIIADGKQEHEMLSDIINSFESEVLSNFDSTCRKLK